MLLIDICCLVLLHFAHNTSFLSMYPYLQTVHWQLFIFIYIHIFTEEILKYLFKLVSVLLFSRSAFSVNQKKIYYFLVFFFGVCDFRDAVLDFCFCYRHSCRCWKNMFQRWKYCCNCLPAISLLCWILWTYQRPVIHAFKFMWHSDYRECVYRQRTYELEVNPLFLYLTKGK